MFNAYRPLSKSRETEVWQKGLVCVDTNILLHLYRVDDELRNTLFLILKHLASEGRLFIPQQVVLEFYRNRISVIHEQTQLPASVEKAFDESIKKVEQSLRKNVRLIAKVNKAKSAFIASLKEAVQSLDNRIDPILEKFEEFGIACVGQKVDEAELVMRMAEAQKRKLNKTPPGFRDQENNDYLVWAECIAACKMKSLDLLFVTDDVKEDWYWRVSGQTHGARAELRHEFTKSVSGQQVVLSPFDYFIENIKIPELTITKEAVSEATEITAAIEKAYEADQSIRSAYIAAQYRSAFETLQEKFRREAEGTPELQDRIREFKDSKMVMEKLIKSLGIERDPE